MTDATGKQFMGVIVNGARAFPVKGSGLNIAEFTGLASDAYTGVSHVIDAALPSTSAGLGGVVSGLWSAAAIAAGLAQIGKASMEGKKIDALRTTVNIYSNIYAETMTKCMSALAKGEKIKIDIGASQLPEKFKVLEQLATRDVVHRLSCLGEEKALQVYSHLIGKYQNEDGIASALRHPVRDVALKNADSSTRTSVTGTKNEPEYYPDPFKTLQWPVSSGQPQAQNATADEGLLPSRAEDSLAQMGEALAQQQKSQENSSDLHGQEQQDAQQHVAQNDQQAVADEGLLPSRAEGSLAELGQALTQQERGQENPPNMHGQDQQDTATEKGNQQSWFDEALAQAAQHEQAQQEQAQQNTQQQIAQNDHQTIEHDHDDQIDPGANNPGFG